MTVGKLLMAGQWREGTEHFSVTNPYSGEKIADVFSAGPGQIEEAIASAVRAAKKMRRLARFEIAKGLRKIAAGIENRKKEFAETITRESAKPISLARGEVERSIATFSWAASEAERFAGEVVPIDVQAVGRGKTAYTEYVPRGIIFGITPFNFPLNLVVHKVAPALASRNAVIIKPSERTPLTSLLLGEVFLESGLPASALQVVPLDVKHIDTLLADDRIGMVSFTGSAEIGWLLKNRVGRKVVTLELGGNAPVIIDATANVQRSAERCIVGAFTYSGQVCISVQRILVHDRLFEAWTNNFTGQSQKLRTGDPLQESTQLSVMITEHSAARAEGLINEAVAGGAKILCGGDRKGALLEATVLTDSHSEMRVVNEEVYAPVVVVERFNDFQEAVDRANQSNFGLQAGVFTENLVNANYAASNLEYGGVVINDIPTFRVDNMPYGGVKQSGFGREGVGYAMREMCEMRLVIMNG
jgi:acyl-CoA reductase-like NAD-dependent aldehyde dehydrogenase